MARTGILTGGSNSAQTTSEDLNGLSTDFISDGIVGALTNTSGVAPMTGGLAVNAQGTPNTTTAITAGIAYVTATPTSQGSQRLRVKIDAQNYTHSANATGATRYDWIYVAVSASLAANPIADMSTTGTIVVSRSTSSSVDNGTPPTYGYCIAKVTLANGFATVVNGNIADVRIQTGANSIAAGTSVARLYNPYKFSVYRNAAQNTGAAADAVVNFDTKEFDTGSNVDIVTNKGRFTAPIAGFYYFSANVNASTGTYLLASIYKNGAAFKFGSEVVSNAGSNAAGVSALMQLAVGDYVEIYSQSNAAKALGVGAASLTYFSGFLVSAT